MGVLSNLLTAGETAVGGVAKAISGAGKAISSSVDALGEARQESNQQNNTSEVITSSMGLVGSAGVSNIVGGGTIPARKNVPKANASNKMPTEKLLNIAVQYLSKIDASLKKQMDYQVENAREQDAARIELKQENESSLSKMIDSAKSAAGGALSLGKRAAGSDFIKTAAMIAAAAAAAKLMTLDPKEMDNLKKSIDEFQKKFGWLEELAGFGLVGWMLGRGKGAMVAVVANALVQLVGADSTIGKSIINTAGTAALGYLGFNGVKSGMSAASRFGNFRKAGARFAETIEAGRSGSFFKSARWRKFLTWLAKKAGPELVAKIERRIAATVAGAALTATGVGTAVGIIWDLVNLGLDLYLAWEIIGWWRKFEAEEKDGTDEDLVKESQDAQKQGGSTISGAPVASADEQKSFKDIPADVEKILATIRTRESGGNYGAQNPSSTASGAYQFLDGSWQNLTRKYGIGSQYPKAKLAPPEVQDQVAARYVQEILQQAGGDVSKVPVAWYTGNIQGVSSAVSPATVAEYQRNWMNTYTGGKYSPSSYQESPDSSSGEKSSFASSSVESIANVLKAVKQTVFDIVDGKQADLPRQSPLGAMNIMKNTAIINREAAKNRADATVGARQEAAKEESQTRQSTVEKKLRGLNGGTLDVLDPNYKVDPNNIISKYFLHFGMAA